MTIGHEALCLFEESEPVWSLDVVFQWMVWVAVTAPKLHPIWWPFDHSLRRAASHLWDSDLLTFPPSADALPTESPQMHLWTWGCRRSHGPNKTKGKASPPRCWLRAPGLSALVRMQPAVPSGAQRTEERDRSPSSSQGTAVSYLDSHVTWAKPMNLK